MHEGVGREYRKAKKQPYLLLYSRLVDYRCNLCQSAGQPLSPICVVFFMWNTLNCRMFGLVRSHCEVQSCDPSYEKICNAMGTEAGNRYGFSRRAIEEH